MADGLFASSRGFFVFLGGVSLVAAINLSLGANLSGLFGLEFGSVSAWITTIAVLVALLAYFGSSRRGRIDAVIIDERDLVSLSRLQFVLWMLLLFPALMTADYPNIALGSVDPLKIAIPPEVWALIEIGAFSFVAAPGVINSRKTETPSGAVAARAAIEAAASNEGSAPPTAIGDVSSKQTKTKGDARWSDVVRGDTVAGLVNLDIGKVQQLAITIVLALVYAASLYRPLSGLDVGRFPERTLAFPADESGFVALLALSHASYLAYKRTSA